MWMVAGCSWSHVNVGRGISESEKCCMMSVWWCSEVDGGRLFMEPPVRQARVYEGYGGAKKWMAAGCSLSL